MVSTPRPLTEAEIEHRPDGASPVSCSGHDPRIQPDLDPTVCGAAESVGCCVSLATRLGEGSLSCPLSEQEVSMQLSPIVNESEAIVVGVIPD